MSEVAAHVRFPGVDFLSQAEFDLFCREHQPTLDRRFAYEQRLAATGNSVIRSGSCAPCLRASRFTTAASEWRDGQVCDCDDGLGQRARAMLHLLEAELGLDGGSQVLLLGPPSPLDRRLGAGRTPPVRLPRLVRAGAGPGHDGYQLDTPDAAFTIAVCWDYLHRIPPLPSALAEIRRALAPGGQFAFTVPFHYRAAHTISRLGHVPRRFGRLPAEFRGEIHEIGWDILALLRDAGFVQARAHHGWSDELGYLGAFNLLFSASL